MAIPAQDRVKYFLENVPSDSSPDWWNSFQSFVDTGEMPAGAQLSASPVPYTDLAKNQTLSTIQQDISNYQSPYSTQEAFDWSSYLDSSGKIDLGRLNTNEGMSTWYKQVFGVGGPGGYGSIKGLFPGIDSPADMENAYRSFANTLASGEIPEDYDPISASLYGSSSNNPTFLTQQTQDQVNSMGQGVQPDTFGLRSGIAIGTSGTLAPGFEYNPSGTFRPATSFDVEYGDFINSSGGTAQPTNTPGTMYEQAGLNFSPSTNPYSSNRQEPFSANSALSPEQLARVNEEVPGALQVTDYTQPSPYLGGMGAPTGQTTPTPDAAPTNNTNLGTVNGSSSGTYTGTQGNTMGTLGTLQDLGAYVPGTIRTGNENEVTADVFRESTNLAELGRRQDRSDIMGTTDQWADANNRRADEVRGYLGDYEDRLMGTTADYEAGLDARTATDQATLRGLLDPYATQGFSSTDEALSLAGSPLDVNLESDPGYQFRMREGEKALMRKNSAGGTALSGGALKELARYSQGLASQEYGAAYDRTSRLRNERLSLLSELGNRGLQSNMLLSQLIPGTRGNLQDRSGVVQNLASTAVDQGQVYNSRLGALTGSNTQYTDSLGNSLNTLGTNQAQILANREATAQADRDSRRSLGGQLLTAAAMYFGGNEPSAPKVTSPAPKR